MTRTESLRFVALVAAVVCSFGRAEQDNGSANGKVYHNQFAVHIPDGSGAADEVASRYGFTNVGQVSVL